MHARPSALLIYPPVYDFALYDLYLKPYGLLRIAQWLQHGGWNVDILDCLDYRDKLSIEIMGKPKRKADGTGKFFKQHVPMPEPLRGIERIFSRYGILPAVVRSRIASSQPDIVLVSSGMTYWYPGIEEVVQVVREDHPQTPVIVGGIYATLMPEHCRERIGPDRVISGDAWDELSRFLESYRLPVPAPPDGSLHRQLQAPEAPAHTNPQPQEIYPPVEKDLWGDAGVIQLNRGCPFSCSYCASTLLCPRFHPGNAEAAFEYLTRLYRLGITNIGFYDDALLVRKEQVLVPFLERVIEEELDVHFYLPNAIHLQFIDEDTAGLMRRAGFQEVRIGLESAFPAFHETHDHKIDIDRFPEYVELLKNAGFPPEAIGVYVLAGLPGQPAGEVEETIRYAAAQGVQVFPSEYSPVPGTPLWEASITHSRYPLAEEPLYHNNTFFPMEWEGFTRDDLEQLKQLARELRRKG